MTDYEEEIRKNLASDWGKAARHSDYKVSDILRYRLPGGETVSGVIVWVAAQSDSHVIGRLPLPMRYIVERHGWTGFPDVVYSGDIIVT
jgi:hypothetical protein